MSDQRLLSVIVPVFNERETVRPAVERLLKTELPVPLEVIVVDDGSTDGSIDRIADLIGSRSITVLRHAANKGKGAAVRAGLSRASGEIVTILDADLEYDPDNFRDLLEPILAGDTAVAYGTRSFGAHTAFSFWYVIGNKVLGLWASFLYDTWLSDVETCLKMARVDVWRSLRLRASDFGIEAEATAKFLRSGHRIYEVPIHYRARTREEGKKLSWTDGVRALWILLRVRVTGR
jgi:glycosyltransferase involved in cell wall biosynthesis